MADFDHRNRAASSASCLIASRDENSSVLQVDLNLAGDILRFLADHLAP
jgi:hypothetical protein